MRREAPLLVGVLLVLGSCSSPVSPPRARRVEATPVATQGSSPAPQVGVKIAATGLRRFESCDSVLSHFRSAALRIAGPWGVAGYSTTRPRPFVSRRADTTARMSSSVAGAGAAGAGAAGSAAAVAPAPRAPTPAFSRTNVQEADVDEPDVVKTDGRTIFVLPWIGPRRLLAIRPGPEPTVLGSLALEDGHDKQLILEGSRVLVVGPAGYERRNSDGTTHATQGTHVTVIDVSDPASMRIERRLHLEGGMVSARLYSGTVWLVVRSAQLHLPFAHPYDGEHDDAAATSHNKRVVRRSGLDDWLPRYRTSDARGRTTEARLGSCSDAYHPSVFSGMGRTTVVSLDPAQGSVRSASTLLADAQTVYASKASVYVATTRWHNPGFGPAPRHVTTQIHRFDVSDATQPRYLATGSVPGILLNQWSLSEHNGVLRVASTAEAVATRAASSMVTVLETRGSALLPVGSVGGLGVGERIYAVRFMGDVGYVVTFRRIDPLYVIDLSRPTRPRVIGELKIPGYSSYLHPIEDGLLLGIGQDAEDTGWVLGLQAAVFDVSDARHPRQTHKVRLDHGQSRAEYDHRAFLWWASNQLAVLPVSMWQPGGNEFVGALAIRAGRAGVQEAARITHDRYVYPERYAARTEPAPTPSPTPQPTPSPAPTPGLVERLVPLLTPAPTASPAPSAAPLRASPWWWWYSKPHASIDRSFVVGDWLYTLSGSGLLTTNLDSLDDGGWLPWS